MIVKYCSRCSGKPYTTDMGMNTCPKCGSALGIKTVQTDELEDCEELIADSFVDESSGSKNLEVGNGGGNEIDFSGDDNNDSIVDFEAMNSKHNQTVVDCGDHVIKGKVSQYSSSGKEDGNYRRLFVQKVADALFYRQRVEDVLHRFKVRVSGTPDAFGNSVYTDVQVNVHGTIAGGAQITDNSEVEVYGKYRNGVFMARKVNVVNNGYKTPVNFQHSARATLYGILAIIAAVFLIYVGVSSDGGFFQNIGVFLKTWLITAAVITVLYLLSAFTRLGRRSRRIFGGGRGFPIVGILLLSLVLTLIFVNSFCLGASIGGLLSSLISSVATIAITIVGIVILIKLLLGKL